MSARPHLSPLVRWLLALLLSDDDRRVLLSELEEGFQIRRRERGEAAARAWLGREGRRAIYHACTSGFRRGLPRATGALLDTRHAFRRLLRAPSFSLAVFLTVALGVGGTTAVFALVHAVLIQPLPFPDSHELVQIYTVIPGQQWNFSMADADALSEQQSTFESLAFLTATRSTLETPEGAEQVRVRLTTPSFFTLAGIEPEAGRTLTESDAAPEAEGVAMVSWGFWQRRLGGDPARLGETIRVAGDPVTVVGVLPRKVDPLSAGYDIVLPLTIEPPARKGPFFLMAVGRVKAELRGAAAAELMAIEDRIFPQWEASWPRPEATWAMRDLEEQVVGDAGQALWVALGAVLLLLLLASSNISNLLVTRGLAQRREMSVRAALGASRTRLLQSSGAESAVLALFGTGAALAVAFAGIEVVTTYGAGFIPRIDEVGFTGPVVLFFVGISVGVLCLFALVPTLRMSTVGSGPLVFGGLRGAGSDMRAHRLRRALVTFEFAAAAPLLVGAALLLVSLASLRGVDPGFDARHTLSARLVLPPSRYTATDTAEIRATWDRITDRVSALPGVQAAGVGTGRPPDRPAFGNNFVLEDRPLAPGEAQPSTPWVIAEPGYFDALGLEVVEGRMFDGQQDPPAVVLVDRAWATRFFPGESAVGRRLRHGACTLSSCSAWTVLGVVENVRYTGLDDPGEGTVYMNLQRWTSTSAFLVVRSEGDEPEGLVPSVRRALLAEEPGIAVVEPSTGVELLSDTLQEPRYLGALMGTLAALALLLSMVGVYGTMAYFVRHQRRSIGIRMALGVRSPSVAREVLVRGVALAAAGTAFGMTLSFALSGYLDGVLFAVRPTDARAYAGISLLLLGLAAGACCVPAYQAANTNPAALLREE